MTHFRRVSNFNGLSDLVLQVGFWAAAGSCVHHQQYILPDGAHIPSGKQSGPAVLLGYTMPGDCESLRLIVQEAAKRGLLPVVTGLIFSIYSFCNFFVSPLHGWLMQRR